ncbi:MAG: hypothetical protein SPG09_05340, partial [Lachnospiraceae bacterium]|nr:hypothetical protein [bacterium]MDY5517018.1 hypothetical protein [Lachnospiraceae bacterium]
MKRRMTRLFCLLLSSAMMLTGNAYGALKYPGVIEVSAAETEAAAETKTYTMAEIKETNSWGLTITPADTGVCISYEKQYNEARFAIPEELLGRVQGITCNIKEADQVGNLATKVYDKVDDYKGGDENAVQYNSNSIKNWDSGIDAKSFGLMWNATGAADITLVSVTFELNNEYPAGPVTFTVDELEKSFVTDNADYTVSDSKAAITYKKQYEEVRFKVPEAIQDRIESVTFNVSEDVADKLAVKVFDAIGGYDIKEKDVKYGTNSYQGDTEGFSVKSVGLMSMPEGEQNVMLESITFVLKAKQ